MVKWFIAFPIFLFSGLAFVEWIVTPDSMRRAPLNIGPDRIDVAREPEPPPAQLAPEAGLDAIKARDPAFDRAVFLERAQGAFRFIQEAWSAMDMAPARAFVTDGVLERFAFELEALKTDGLRNQIEDLNVLDARIVEAVSDPLFDAVLVRISAEASDKYYSLADGGLQRASSSKFTEIWTFLRRAEAKTRPRGALAAGACPNCGAQAPRTGAAACSSCGSWLNSGELDWVLSEITQESDWLPRACEKHLAGLGLAASDPHLSCAILEDRAAAVFWRWQAALREGSTGPLRAVATEEFCSALAKDQTALGHSFKDAGVASIDLLAFEEGADMDRCHVMVKWSAVAARRGPAPEEGPVDRDDVLVLERRHGVRTDARQAFASLRCGSCGASPARRDEPACAYCGKAFNDGSRHWVLTRLVARAAWRAPAADPFHTRAGEAPEPSSGLEIPRFDG